MGAKKRAVATSPVEKKAKVVQTEEQIALEKMLSAFDGAVGTMLSPNVVAMVKEISEKCLLPPVENRAPLETKFAEAVGAALNASMEGLEKAHKDATDVVTADEEKVQNLDNALTEANSLKEKADDSLTKANEAEVEATGKKSESEAALAAHDKEEKGLQPKKLTMEAELTGLKEVQETTRGAPDPAKKEVLKVQKALREVEAPEALILGIGAAIGKQTPMDQHFVNEATKLLYDKSTKLEGELATFNETMEEYAKKTRTMMAEVEQLTNELNARMEEQSAAKTHQKECIAAVKEAEKQKKQGEKSLEKAIVSRDEAALAENLGKDTKTQYTFLFDRSIAEPIVEAVEEKAASPAAASPKAASPAAASPVVEGVVAPEAAVVEAAPEAAMEVEPVA
jgi:chromosome segregation ATPase